MQEDAGDAAADDLKSAAESGKVVEIIERLYGTGVFDGLVRFIGKHWSLDDERSNFIVSLAVDELWLALRNGTRVDSPKSFLYKVATRCAYSAKEATGRRGEAEPAYHQAVEFENDADVQKQRRAKRVQAIHIAEELLGRLGQTQAQRVLALVLDAVKQDRSDLTVDEIAEILDMTPEAARKNLQRGMARLNRVAREAGMLPTEIAVLEDDALVLEELED